MVQYGQPVSLECVPNNEVEESVDEQVAPRLTVERALEVLNYPKRSIEIPPAKWFYAK